MEINKDIFTVDLMLGIPEQEDRSDWYTFMEPLLRDEESKTMFKMPAQYMFKDIPETGSHDDFVQYTLAQMDKHHINQAMVGFHEKSDVKILAGKNHPDRFFFDLPVNPNTPNEAENIKEYMRLMVLRQSAPSLLACIHKLQSMMSAGIPSMKCVLSSTYHFFAVLVFQAQEFLWLLKKSS